ncbi:hypothetical protein [Mesorhizobium sp. dw_380]|uniref:hypothetical protein n=1 Tax=Mesorhizobium sp. dw_380 TaxID=2812001 RepID=UPI001BDEDE34|nr:hypothetical protein [Mesorhizobium sp. dw_380]
MQEFCINNQIESYNHLVQTHNGSQNGDEKAMLVKCLGDWKTAAGSDWSMVEFCYKDQHEAYERELSPLATQGMTPLGKTSA